MYFDHNFKTNNTQVINQKSEFHKRDIFILTLYKRVTVGIGKQVLAGLAKESLQRTTEVIGVTRLESLFFVDFLNCSFVRKIHRLIRGNEEN